MTDKVWAVVPAAGIGKRMQAEIPKQYLPLHGRMVIEHTLSRLLGHVRIAGVMVALAEGDPLWPRVSLPRGTPLYTAPGGAERCESVHNALQRLDQYAAPTDWVMVHDAARPCLRRQDIDALIAGIPPDECGGILALPVRDTMKRAQPGSTRIYQTVAREGLWHALTPQIFRLEDLRQALSNALKIGEFVTDEAQAMELAGGHPLLIEGHADNIKITRPEDLALADLYLKQQEETCE